MWASTEWLGLEVLFEGVSQIMSFWSSATDPKRDSWSRCQEISSTTAVCSVKMVCTSTLSLPLEQHLCPTGRWCGHLKHSVSAHWDLGSKKAHSLPSDVHGDASLGCTLQKGLQSNRHIKTIQSTASLDLLSIMEFLSRGLKLLFFMRNTDYDQIDNI